MLFIKYHCAFIMTKVKCFTTGPLYYQIQECELYNNSQGFPLLNVSLRYLTRIVEKCSLQYVVKGKWSRENRFAFNKTYDLCDYMKNRKNNNKVLIMLMNLILPFTNFNHTCPYDVSALILLRLNNAFIFLF